MKFCGLQFGIQDLIMELVYLYLNMFGRSPVELVNLGVIDVSTRLKPMV